ncbi:TetR family transcriptional regulator C-terminal domain-containing protein [Rathayibacter oskolensis]|uniref:TetR family transcriptional regulator C-terminal domain-containing protein n=1 Tax=Rathayibacter oskolensis TaxID=1891671 RepID=UPI003467EB38
MGAALGRAHPPRRPLDHPRAQRRGRPRARDRARPRRAGRLQLVELVAYNTQIPGLVELQCVLSAEATHADHPAHEYFANRYRYVVDLFTDAFGDMLTRGQLVPGVDPRSAAIRTVATMDGLQVQWLLQRDALDMQTEFRRSVQTLTTVEV